MRLRMRETTTMTLVLYLMVVSTIFTCSQAYQGPVGNKRPTKLSAWSMPTMSTTTSTTTSTSTSAPFGLLTHTWYNEYNPTARRTVYKDSPLDYSFVTLGDDWPSAFDTVQAVNQETQQRPRRRKNPLRRAVHWLFHRRS